MIGRCWPPPQQTRTATAWSGSVARLPGSADLTVRRRTDCRTSRPWTLLPLEADHDSYRNRGASRLAGHADRDLRCRPARRGGACPGHPSPWPRVRLRLLEAGCCPRPLPPKHVVRPATVRWTAQVARLVALAPAQIPVREALGQRHWRLVGQHFGHPRLRECPQHGLRALGARQPSLKDGVVWPVDSQRDGRWVKLAATGRLDGGCIQWQRSPVAAFPRSGGTARNPSHAGRILVIGRREQCSTGNPPIAGNRWHTRDVSRQTHQENHGNGARRAPSARPALPDWTACRPAITAKIWTAIVGLCPEVWQNSNGSVSSHRAT